MALFNFVTGLLTGTEFGVYWLSYRYRISRNIGFLNRYRISRSIGFLTGTGTEFRLVLAF
jgi:hypothetical protein